MSPVDIASSASGGATRRIGALVLRHWRLVSGSWPRLIDLAYWPTMQIILWGFVQLHFQALAGHGLAGAAVGGLVSAAIIWEAYFRSQNGFAIGFLEEVWSRNLGHLMVSPLRPWEFVSGLIVISIIKTVIGLLPATILAALVFHANVLEVGPALALLYLGLAVFGWSVGLFCCGLVLRFGQGAEVFAWAVALALAPFSAIYYPISVLPDWIEPLARLLPTAHVFEGLRAILLTHAFPAQSLLWVLVLNVLWFGCAAFAFSKLLDGARERGSLVSIGE
ncbi:MAG: ABC transporter permease [Caulobacterales bacterium]